MHLMYVDESGDDGFKLDLPPDTPGSSKVFARLIYENSPNVHEFHFIESIFFEPSDSSLLLQIADAASYAFYRKFAFQDSSFYDCLSERIFSPRGRSEGTGLKIWPSIPDD